MCPHCGSESPIVYRGALAFCSACNKPRVPLTAAGVNLAGKPAKIGGLVASVTGWVVLGVMMMIALLVGAFFQAIFPPGAIVGWVVGGIIAALGIAAALVLLLGGRFLTQTGDKAVDNVRREAVFALARNEGGVLRTPMAARALGVPVPEAEAFLTGLSRNPDSGVTLEVDGEGKLYYRFTDLAPDVWPPPGTALAPPPLAAATLPNQSLGATSPSPVADAPVRVATGTEIESPALTPGPRVMTQPMPAALADAEAESDALAESEGDAGTKRAGRA
jgi:hypothetical protein